MTKPLLLIVAIFLALSSCGPSYITVQNPPAYQPPPPPSPEPEEVSYQTFYDELSPYGQWIDYPGYGYVWMPNVEPGFKPYATNGHWVYSDAGWVWASDYNWGWATFHYGRWFFDQFHGWMWVPGNEWAPAWVSWRRSPDYYGWAPLGPHVSVGVSISDYNPPSNYWCFVPHQYVNSPHVNNYYVNETRNVTIINNTTVINNTVVNNNITNNRITNNNTVNNNIVNNNTRNNVYIAGPDATEVSRVTGTAVRPVAIATSNRPGATQISNGQLSIFRPRVNAAAPAAGSSSQQRMAPARVQTLNNVRPVVNNAEPAINNQPASGRENRNNAEPQPGSLVPRPANNPPPGNNSAEPPAVQHTPPPPVQNQHPVNNPPFNQPVARPAGNIPGNQPSGRTENPLQQPPPNPRPAAQPVPVVNTPPQRAVPAGQPANPGRPSIQPVPNRPAIANPRQNAFQQPKPAAPKPAVVNKDNNKKDKPPKPGQP